VDAETLLTYADVAMYRAKRDKNNFRFYENQTSSDS
jgi:hypothetical protein